MPSVNIRAIPALREAAQNLRDPSRVVLHYNHYIEDADGNRLMTLARDEWPDDCRACALGHIDLATRGDWRAEQAALAAAEGLLPVEALADERWDSLTVTLRDHGPVRVAQAFESAADKLEGTNA